MNAFNFMIIAYKCISKKAGKNLTLPSVQIAFRHHELSKNNVTAITWRLNDSCEYDSSTSSVKSIEPSGQYKPGDWNVKLDTKYPSESEGIVTRLQGNCHYIVSNTFS